MAYKSGFVTIVGRPNVGKSTLLNIILGQKVVITSDKPQTTRKRIRGVYTTEKGQIVFIDTPGVQKPQHKFHEFMMTEAKLAIPSADVILFLVDVTEKAGPGDKWIAENLLNTDATVIMVANKVDQMKNMEKRDENLETYKELFKDKKVTTIKMSALTGRNQDDLINNIYRKLPKGPQYFPEDNVTDQNIRAISEEIIREKVLHNTRDEIPHSVAVIIDKFQELPNITNIRATIYVEHDSQKGIVIGDGGQMIKTIGMLARKEIEELTEGKVFLELFVKLKKNWRKNSNIIREFGFKSENF
ncbi:MAG: GTPase Era [bacterium]